MQNIYPDFMALFRLLVEVNEQVCQLRWIEILVWQLPLRYTERKVRKDSKIGTREGSRYLELNGHAIQREAPAVVGSVSRYPLSDRARVAG